MAEYSRLTKSKCADWFVMLAHRPFPQKKVISHVFSFVKAGKLKNNNNNKTCLV